MRHLLFVFLLGQSLLFPFSLPASLPADCDPVKKVSQTETIPLGNGFHSVRNETLEPAFGAAELKSLVERAKAAGTSHLVLSISPVGPEQRKSLTANHFYENASQPGEWHREISENHPKAKYFNAIAEAIEKNQEKIREILGRVNTTHGTDFEIKVTLSTLRGMAAMEMHHLDNTKTLNNVAVYPATNVPLYTLISHGFVPAAISRNVWFRTPQATREVYGEIYELLKNSLPVEHTERLHVLTSARDTQYDYFRKQQVQGLNRNGTRAERPPSEMVLFTGNPATLKSLLETNQAKLTEAYPHGGYKQVFLGFGAGASPAIVTRGAKDNLEQAVDLTLDTIRMNCRQDCEAPDFYLVDKAVQKKYVAGLLAKIQKMKAGATNDPNSDFSPLTMATKLDHLVEYKKKYEKYLVNGDAFIDVEKKIVSPHVFVIPFSEFKETELREHFAPFLTVFTYSNETQLQEAIRDPRVQKKALYGSIFGGKVADASMDEAAGVLRENSHGVIINASSYEGVFANMAFGGRGTDVSVVSTLNHSEGEKLTATTANHPVLFSEEAYRAFPAPVSVPRGPLLGRDFYTQKLEKVLDQINEPPSQLGIDVSWSSFQEMQTENRATGMEAIRKVAQEEGLFMVLPPGNYSNEELKRQEAFRGVRLVVAKNSTSPQKMKGVLLHPSNVGDGSKLLNLIRGTMNPHLNRGNLGARLEDKLLEAQLTEAILPGAMPRSESLGEYIKSGVISPELMKEQAELKGISNSILSGKKQLSDSERIQLQKRIGNWLNQIFDAARARSPQGVYFKSFGESATGDFGTTITTFGSNPSRLAEEYVRRLETVTPGRRKDLSHLDVDKTFNAVWHETGSKFIRKMLSEPESILVQEKVMLAKTPMGFPAEYRVDFVDGEAVLGRSRFSHEYLPDDIQQAQKFLNDFFKKAPAEFRHLSGGADVVRTVDGKWMFIEFNTGSTSGTLEANYFPIESHLIMEKLQGKPTAFLSSLRSVHQNGVEAELSYLKNLKQVRSKFFRESFEDLSVVDIGKYFRTLHLEEWAKDPTPEKAKETLDKLKILLGGFGPEAGEDLDNLLKGAENYLFSR